MVDFRDKNELVQFTVIIEVNRILKEISVNELCDGIVSSSQYSSYLTGSIKPTREIASPLLNKLGILYLEDIPFLTKTKDMLLCFIDEHMFNEFDQALWRYTEIEANEDKILSSPLIVEYLIVKMAYYSIHDIDIYAKTLKILDVISPLMTRDQTFLYNLYLGINAFKIKGDIDLAKEYFKKTREYGGHPHIYTWIGISELFNNKIINSTKMFEKARNRYINDGNLTGLIFSLELSALAYYRENDYVTGIELMESAIKYSKTVARDHLTSNFKNQIAWGYYRLKEYDKALKLLERDRYNNDYTVNSSVTKFLIAYDLDDEKILGEVKEELENRNRTLHRMLYTIVSNDNFVKENHFEIDEEDLLSMIELAKITHFELEKAFTNMLINYYIKNNMYEKLVNYCKEEIKN